MILGDEKGEKSPNMREPLVHNKFLDALKKKKIQGKAPDLLLSPMTYLEGD